MLVPLSLAILTGTSISFSNSNLSSDTGFIMTLKGYFALLIFAFLRFCVYFLKKLKYNGAKRKYQDEVAEYEANKKCVADLQSEIKRLDNK